MDNYPDGIDGSHPYFNTDDALYCDECGEELPDDYPYCPWCGTRRAPGPSSHYDSWLDVKADRLLAEMDAREGGAA